MQRHSEKTYATMVQSLIAAADIGSMRAFLKGTLEVLWFAVLCQP